MYGGRSRHLAGEPFGLFGEMVRNSLVEPALDLGG
jgi:hypothetical protein